VVAKTLARNMSCRRTFNTASRLIPEATGIDTVLSTPRGNEDEPMKIFIVSSMGPEVKDLSNITNVLLSLDLSAESSLGNGS